MPLIATRGAASAQGFGEFAQTTAPVYIEDVFSTYLYTGTNPPTATQTIINNIDLSTKGGLVWVKTRNAAEAHILTDTVRGANNILQSQATDPSYAVSNFLNSFNSNGFTVGNSLNLSSWNLVSWTFREQPKFFDVVTYTGTGSAQTINHSLGSAPGCIIIKQTSGAGGTWWVWHTATNTFVYRLNTTDSQIAWGTLFNGVQPTSTSFQVGANGNSNANGETYVAYLFAHNAGGFGLTGSDNVISCGSFTTDGSGNATVSLGYEPQWLLVKRTDSSAGGGWYIIDQMRGFTANTSSGMSYLFANTSDAESTGITGWYPTATGFGISSGGYASRTYIYIAIRRGPMKTPTSGTSVYSAVSRTGTGTTTNVTGASFPPDFVITKSTTNASNTGAIWYDRLRGITNPLLYPQYTSGEQGGTNPVVSFNMTGVTLNDSQGWGVNMNTVPYINYFFLRAPGFFDEVCYTGTGSAGQTYNHNLGVVPELIIVKRRSGISDWSVYSSTVGATGYLLLNTTDASVTGVTTRWNDTAPTSTVFSTGTSSAVNGSGSTYVAYLFASVSGVSKVGSYTGTGALQTINCGFTSGARWIMIKRTDSTGDWWVYDSTRGISSGNDPYFFMNTAAADVTNTNYVDTTSVGFQVTAAAPAGLNANGGSYLFLAIA